MISHHWREAFLVVVLVGCAAWFYFIVRGYRQ